MEPFGPSESSINEQPGFKHYSIAGLLQRLDIAADLWVLPAMDRHAESSSCSDAWDEGCNRREKKWSRLQIVCFCILISLKKSIECSRLEGESRRYADPDPG
jgi:hypothetical protein